MTAAAVCGDYILSMMTWLSRLQRYGLARSGANLCAMLAKMNKPSPLPTTLLASLTPFLD